MLLDIDITWADIFRCLVLPGVALLAVAGASILDAIRHRRQEEDSRAR